MARADVFDYIEMFGLCSKSRHSFNDLHSPWDYE